VRVSTELDTHALDGGGNLFVVANVGAEAEGVAAGVLDFEVAEVELGFTAGEESDAGALAGEADGQAFADSAACSGDQDWSGLK
jgi:hypothetical protein